MREWNLGPEDPLVLSLAANSRLCTLDLINDQIWELEIGGGDPSALALRTTFGLRARLMRIFPRFHLGDQVLSDPGAFALQPFLRRFAPNFLLVTFAPFPGISVTAEYWIADSHTAAGRFTVENNHAEDSSMLLELCGQLVPMEGQPLAAIAMQSANVLAGRSMDLSPVVFLTGGPLPGPGPYPSLVLDLHLSPGESRTLTWVQASLATLSESFEHARRTAARSWDAERAHLEMVNSAQVVDVTTGDPDWDAAFAFSQKVGFSLLMGSSTQLPHPSFVLSREPDQGYSPSDAGREYSHLWIDQPALETGYLASNLPGSSKLIPGLLRNFLAAQGDTGRVDPGLAGQRGSWLPAPMLASMAWKYACSNDDKDFLLEIFPKLKLFLLQWLDPAHDRDEDGFPEWDHPLQSGVDDHPIYSIWQDGSQGGDITCAESPALAAMLHHDFLALANIARTIDLSGSADELELVAAHLHSLVEECWNSNAALYHSRDRDSHHSPEGKLLASQNGSGTFPVRQSFNHPTRLLIEYLYNGETIRRPVITVQGRFSREAKTESFERMDFQWYSQRGVATSRSLYTSITSIQLTGLEKRDTINLHVMDFSREDISLFLPLWAGIPSADRAHAMINNTMFSADHFGRPFGILALRARINPSMLSIYPGMQ